MTQMPGSSTTPPLGVVQETVAHLSGVSLTRPCILRHLQGEQGTLSDAPTVWLTHTQSMNAHTHPRDEQTILSQRHGSEDPSGRSAVGRVQGRMQLRSAASTMRRGRGVHTQRVGMHTCAWGVTGHTLSLNVPVPGPSHSTHTLQYKGETRNAHSREESHG